MRTARWMNGVWSLTGRLRMFFAGAAIVASTTSISVVTGLARRASGTARRVRFATTCTSLKETKVVGQETTQPEPLGFTDEQLALHRHRYRAARACGLDMRDAKLFASSNCDIQEMRDLASRGCPPHLILLIL